MLIPTEGVQEPQRTCSEMKVPMTWIRPLNHANWLFWVPLQFTLEEKTMQEKTKCFSLKPPSSLLQHWFFQTHITYQPACSNIYLQHMIAYSVHGIETEWHRIAFLTQIKHQPCQHQVHGFLLQLAPSEEEWRWRWRSVKSAKWWDSNVSTVHRPKRRFPVANAKKRECLPRHRDRAWDVLEQVFVLWKEVGESCHVSIRFSFQLFGWFELMFTTYLFEVMSDAERFLYRPFIT